MKVGINTLFLIPGEVGGTETYLRETLNRLAEEHPVRVGALQGRKPAPANPG